ncbi:proton-coupled zinc antiporter SLC30A9, mitochondrial [Toxorhynchites rutilus septentrionalis]|uniref:proton-coupled zinc antiporter SLC30A9, mitochondrial n=1 Tax=Toxorhynchites rutilus septentrionalis TaxID=329112 RepID=UPI0024791BD6|nr:proton-coupled zinc antiporter SLC30A9, mitochondrial [Toxorhynchites rutilus septentrionalis]XP_055629462.1 proton-coupled zinc antiporter SLC30A9, mitochondrial [Toxorhynchites rutilus septentrionalis]
MIFRVVEAAKVARSPHFVSYFIFCKQKNTNQIGILSLRALSVLTRSKIVRSTLVNNSRRPLFYNINRNLNTAGFLNRPQSTTTKEDKNSASAESQTQETTLEINTKAGKLIVTTTTADSKLQEVIIEKPKPEDVAQDIDAVSQQADQIAVPNEEQLKAQEAVAKEQLAEKNRQLAKKRIRVDFSRSSLERNFITPVRAMTDFLLKPSDLENLAKTKRRSPYEQEPPITVYWRKDVEAKAIEVWGTRENLLKECLKREIEKKRHQQNIFTVKRRLRDYRREIGSRTNVVDSEPGLFGNSGKVVLTAIAINATNCLFKFGAWLYTGSHSMFAETIHSLADTINQLILAYGIHKSTQIADPDHPYGYSNMKYVSSLISGVGIFCVGTGLSFYHGIMGLVDPHPIDDFYWAFFILGGSMVSEGATLLVAINSCRSGAKALGMSFRDYVVRGQDPCVNVVLTEDAAAVLSVGLAATCMGLSTYTGSPIPDAVGSLLVGCMLGGVASFIIYTNVAALVGRSIRQENLDKINAELESDIMIRAIHDVKGIDMGNSLVRYKAEMDFDGRELTRVYLDKQDLNVLLDEVKTFQTTDELEAFLLTHGESIVDLMGGEIDRIEMKLRKKFPEIRHCDLEIL